MTLWAWKRKSKAIICALSLAAVSIQPHGAWAQEREIRITGGSLSTAIAEISRQTGISIGMEGRLPKASVAPLHGQLSPAAALRQLLEGTGLIAKQVGANSFRLERAPKAANTVAPVRPAPSPIDIVVTGSKRDEAILDVPISMSVVSLSPGANISGVGTTADIAGHIEGLSLTNLGPGRNRQFIRGVADSPFNGPSQSTVSLQIDEVRATYNAPDPDLRLIDMERVEVLKGPQGPLYGTGALGGVYRMVTRKPDLNRVAGFASLDGSLINSGDGAVGGSAMVNLPLAQDRLSLRIVGYGDRESGWIDTAAGGDRNDMTTSGGRIALRWAIADDWTVDLAGAAQWLRIADSQYVFTRHSRSRDTTIAERHDNDFRFGSLTLHGALGSAQLTAAASLVRHEVDSDYDATASATYFGISGPAQFDDERNFRLFDGEVRLSGGAAGGWGWLTGVSYLDADNSAGDDITDIGSGVSQDILNWRQHISEVALFGEVSVPITPSLRAVSGARLFHATIENERTQSNIAATDSRHKTGFTPSLAVQWHPRSDAMLFIRAASAFRPGGLSSADSGERRYDSDQLMTIEMGGRMIRDDHLIASATLFRTIWKDIQSDSLLANGLVSTRNVGDGRIEGFDLSLDHRWMSGWSIDAGVQYQFARLVKSAAGLDLEDDRRLPVVPDLALRIGVKKRFNAFSWNADAGASVHYTGTARLSFDADLDRKMGDYATVDLSWSMRKGGWALAAALDNVLDSRADSFAFGNPFSIRSMDQYTPVRPRSFRLAIARNW